MALAEKILGELEMLDEYAPEMILDSIRTLCLQEVEEEDSRGKA